MARRRKGVRGRMCSVPACRHLAIVIIGVHGDGRVWHGCTSEHARLIIGVLKEKFPHMRGIWTKGVNHDKYQKR